MSAEWFNRPLRRIIASSLRSTLRNLSVLNASDFVLPAPPAIPLCDFPCFFVVIWLFWSDTLRASIHDSQADFRLSKRSERGYSLGMRVLGGALRGRRLAGAPAAGTRPTTGRVKAALFNILSERIPGARVLDLYAGTGLIGIEALSRGAGYVTFVESNPASYRMVKSNLRRCGYAHLADVRAMSAARFLKQTSGEPYDIAFVDPPYHDLARRVLLLLAGD